MSLDLNTLIQEITQMDNNTITLKNLQMLLNIPEEIINSPDLTVHVNDLINAIDINHDGTFDEKDIEYFKTEMSKGNIGIIINLVRACTALVSSVVQLKSLNLNKQNVTDTTYKLCVAIIFLSVARHNANFKNWINDQTNKDNLILILNTIYEFLISSKAIQNVISEVIKFLYKKCKGCCSRQNNVQDKTDTLLQQQVSDIAKSTKLVGQDKIIADLQQQIITLKNTTDATINTTQV